THCPVSSLRRVLTAIRSLHTDVPPPVCLSSGSLVRFPTRTTRLMFAMLGLLLRRRLRRLRLRRLSVPLWRVGVCGAFGLGNPWLGRLGLGGSCLLPTLLALVARALLDGRQRRRRGAASALDAASGHVAHDAVGDL